MRLLLLAPTRRDPAHARVVRSLARELRARGDAVSLFPPADGLSAAESRRRLERTLARGRFDAFIVQFFSRGLGWLAGARLPETVPLILVHQGASCALLEDRNAFERLVRRSRAVAAVSRAGLADLLESFPAARGKSSVLPNGADAPRPRRAAPPRRPFILTIGRQAAYKGTDLLLLAFAGILEQRPALDLVVCGPDQAGGRLRRFSQRLGLHGRVRFTGAVSAARAARLTSDCLFFVLPSRAENLPMALLEAMAAGKACAASAVGGVPELLSGGRGLLLPPADAPALRRALLKLSGDAALRRRLGAAARRGGRARSWRAVAARYRELCAGLRRGAAQQGRRLR